MKFNTHCRLEGTHAFLSPSKYHWVSYDEEKLRSAYSKHEAAKRGTDTHEFASQAIRLGIKLPKTPKTINLYVNDAIGFQMETEVVLFYSSNCYGSADAICFRQGVLRIHDLKTGHVPVSMTQLEVYSALFCLEYDVRPNDIDFELRVYQRDEVLIHTPKKEDIMFIMDKIITFDKIVEEMKGKLQ